jgi:hypothetical protein
MGFKVNNLSKKFSGVQYPEIAILKGILNVAKDEQLEIIRLYFTEGIPEIFLNNPILYEKIRDFLSSNLKVNSKNISLTGSGRLGYSLSPEGNKFGRKFVNKVSDIDFFIVNKEMFDDFLGELSIYSRITNEISRNKYFDSNLKLLQTTSKFGYLDQNKFPNDALFPRVSKTYSVLRKLLEIMGDTPKCPQPKDASIRVYRDWDSCVNRITLNVVDALHKN